MKKEQRFYWNVDPDSFEIQELKEALFRGGVYHIPRNALTAEPLPPKDGFAVIAELDEKSFPIGSKYIEDYRGKLVYQTKDQRQEEVDELGPVKHGYTLVKPSTQFDEWDGQQWVTNLQAQYDAEYKQTDATRRQQYSQRVDPKISEAQIKRLQGRDTEAAELEQQALAERERIQQENPWPLPPAA